MSKTNKEFYGQDGQEADLVHYHGEAAIGKIDSQVLPIPGSPKAIETLVARSKFLKGHMQPTINLGDTPATPNLLRLLATMETIERTESNKDPAIIDKIRRKLFKHIINPSSSSDDDRVK